MFNSGSSEKSPFEKLYVVYVLYFDEARGHLPLLIHPYVNDNLKYNKTFMRPIKYHPIWFLEIEEQAELDHIDLEFKNHLFLGRKFLTTSKRKKRRAGLKEETPETIVVIICIPNDIAIFGDDLIRIITEKIRENFEDKLFKIIECEIAKEQLIKTENMKRIIEEGTKIQGDLRKLITETSNNYFSKVIKKSDTISIKQQKAISYLTLKGIDLSHINGINIKKTFSNIKFFDPNEKSQSNLNIETPLNISDISIIEDSQEIEILVKNNSEKEINNVIVKITHVKDFFEKELMNQKIDDWFPQEELLFISPIIPYIEEYIFLINDEINKKKLLSKKIDLNILNKIKS